MLDVPNQLLCTPALALRFSFGLALFLSPLFLRLGSERVNAEAAIGSCFISMFLFLKGQRRLGKISGCGAKVFPF